MSGADAISSVRFAYIMTSSLLIGCAGWNISRKNAAVFPTPGTHLQRYAAVFQAVEVNSSFYRPHRPSTYARWHDLVPDDFRFSIKMPRTITHQLRLQHGAAPLNQFLSEISHLRAKLGCVLVQLPPSLDYDQGVATRFFRALRGRVSAAVVCEPRHGSWFEPAASALLSALDIARVIADPPIGNDTDDYAQVNATRMYIRLHGSPLLYHSSYTDAYLNRLAQTLRRYVATGGQVWCIFDNTASGAAVFNAVSLQSRVCAAL